MSARPLLLDPSDPHPQTRAALRDWLALQRCWAFDPIQANLALGRSSDPRVALRTAGALPPPRGEAVEASELRRLERLGVRALPVTSAAYPARLRRLPDAAPLLLLRGQADALLGPAVAIVGPRAPSAYGRAVAEALAGTLAAAGVVIVSGLARGIDGCAHRAALAAGGRSVAVFGCGIDRSYPPEHRPLAEALIERGAVVSEFPPGTPPRGPNFPLRNRIISGLAVAVVLVEARERSGTLVTARLALDQGVDVYAVPGPITAPTSEGTNRLLYEGATPMLGAEALLDDLGLAQAPPPGPAATPETPEPTEADHLGAEPQEMAAVIAALDASPRTRDELARALTLAPAELAAAVLALELGGRVAEERDGRLRLVSPLRGPGL